MDCTEIRNINKKMLVVQGIDPKYLDVCTNLFYDETGNVKKFIVREDSFNVDADTHFVLGGIACEEIIEFEELKTRFAVQKSVSEEIKSKHIYSGTFELCLKSAKLEHFLDLLIEKKWYVHFTSLNMLYWVIVDILDSIEDIKIYLPCIDDLKAMLYRVTKHDIKTTAKLFYNYQYPDLKTADDVKDFMSGLIKLCNEYEKECPQNLKILLLALQKILVKGSQQDYAIFIQNESKHKLIEQLTCFYESEIYTFINSNLIFDNESDIFADIDSRQYDIDGVMLSNYKFVDSKSDTRVQLSDIFVGIMAKYLHAIDVNIENIIGYISQFDENQKRRFNKLNQVIKYSLDYNPTFIHQVTARELQTKLIELVENYGSCENV